VKDGPDTNPNPISRKSCEQRSTPAMEWNIASIEPDRIQTSYHDDGAPAGSRQSTQI